MITLSLCRTWPRRPSWRRATWPSRGGSAKNAWLNGSAAALLERREEILAANARDVQAAPGAGPERRGDRPPDA